MIKLNNYAYLLDNIGKLFDIDRLKDFNIKSIDYDNSLVNIYTIKSDYDMTIVVTIRKYGTGVFKLLDVQ